MGRKTQPPDRADSARSRANGSARMLAKLNRLTGPALIGALRAAAWMVVKEKGAREKER